MRKLLAWLISPRVRELTRERDDLAAKVALLERELADAEAALEEQAAELLAVDEERAVVLERLARMGGAWMCGGGVDA